MKKGEKGIQILAPIVVHRRRKNDQQHEPKENPHPVLIGFAVYVFDVAQNEGADLPELEHNVTGDVGSNRMD